MEEATGMKTENNASTNAPCKRKVCFDFFFFFFFNSYLDRCLAKQVYVTLVEHAFVFGCMRGSVP